MSNDEIDDLDALYEQAARENEIEQFWFRCIDEFEGEADEN
jgi:hypothetical protein